MPQILSTSAQFPAVEASIISPETADIPLTLQLEPDTGSSVYGTTEYYAFAEILDQNTSYSSICITGFEDQTFEIQNTVFVVPSLTQLNGSLLDITIASKSPTSLITVEVKIPTGQQGTLGPQIINQEVSVDKMAQETDSSYQLWQASVDLGLQITGALTINAFADGKLEDVLYLSAGVAAW